MATTAFCTSAKVELLEAGHCFLATQTGITGTTSNTVFTITGLASVVGLAVGMAVAGTNIPAGAVIASIDSTTQVTMSKAATGAAGSSISFTADVFKILLIKISPTRTFDGTQTNVGTPGAGSPTTSNVGTDEVSGTGYTSGGTALTNVSPSTPGPTTTTAVTSFSPNPSWTSASFSTAAGIIYNSSTRLGAAAAPLNGRTISVHDFAGTQTVSSGTFTVVMPTVDSNNAILRIA
jgi:hypothetical protein